MELQKKKVNRNMVLGYNEEVIVEDIVESNVENNIIPIDIYSANSDLVGLGLEVEAEVEERQVETIILGEGETLRLLALELFGDKAFWVYIYQENIDLIPNPNIVSSGLKLKIPDIDKYFIRKDDSESISKAMREGVKALDKKRYF
jgi:hypothetical protein